MKIIDKSGNISEYEKPKFQPDWNRIILIIITVLYLSIFGWLGGWAGFLRMFLFLILPFCCIWFPKPLGGYKINGLPLGKFITKTSPGIFVLTAGWLLYIALGFLLFYWKINKII